MTFTRSSRVLAKRGSHQGRAQGSFRNTGPGERAVLREPLAGLVLVAGGIWLPRDGGDSAASGVRRDLSDAVAAEVNEDHQLGHARCPEVCQARGIGTDAGPV